jgi:hypothetical protein
VEKAYKYIRQTNSYGCGVVAVMNAINYSMAQNGLGRNRQYNYFNIPELEDILKTNEEFGTDEKEMVKFLRNYFYVTVNKKFSKKKLDKWLADGNQAIILYPYSGPWELHYSNVYERRVTRMNCEYYKGANVWWKKPSGLRWSMSRIIRRSILKSMYMHTSITIYLKWKGTVIQ